MLKGELTAFSCEPTVKYTTLSKMLLYPLPVFISDQIFVYLFNITYNLRVLFLH